MAGLFDLMETVGPYVAALKTHVDLVDDWSAEAWAFLRGGARGRPADFRRPKVRRHRKDQSRSQMAGIYDVRSWSDLVTAHLISGPDVVDGLQAGWKDVGRRGAAFCCSHRCPVEAICSTPTTPVKWWKTGAAHDGVFGFIGNGSRPDGTGSAANRRGRSEDDLDARGEPCRRRRGNGSAIRRPHRGRAVRFGLHHRRFRHSQSNDPAASAASLRRRHRGRGFFNETGERCGRFGDDAWPP